MNELERIRQEYARRTTDARYREWYSSYNKAHLFTIQVRERAVLSILQRHGFVPLRDRLILEVGCGQGDELRRLIFYDASPRNLFGLDITVDRIHRGRHRAPNLHFVGGNGACLPFSDATFDLCIQFTLFSSVLDVSVKQQIAGEMLRVLKPQGGILWYDYWLNPTNPQTQGVRPKEIRQLFPGCTYEFRKITLAPPLARWLARYSWLACELLECIPWLRTHYLAMIRKAPETR